jgi:hypothetical protein
MPLFIVLYLLPQLKFAEQVRTLVFDGDADYICNYMGVELMVS